ncbi:hypothetical protein CW752_08655 [Chryseobacterium sp. PMSZPI]|nr:hypothetical protein CW752_08655 [Chryseobacterium sp. PMSZPI]
MLFSNMIYSVISHVKQELYESTQYNIEKHGFKNSETICFAEKDLEKAEWREEKEFSLNGFSYDIIKVSIINGKKFFFCYIDKKDIIINSLLDFSKKFTTKKMNIRRQIDLPLHEKSLFKTSGFLAIFEQKEFNFFRNSYSQIILNYDHQLENTHYLSIIIPPPEMIFTL